jgi:outer membrane protein
MTRVRPSYLLALTTACVGLGAAACSSPFEQATTEELRESIRQGTLRDLRSAAVDPARREVTRQSRIDQLEFTTERLSVLDEMGGPMAYDESIPDLGPDLLGRTGENTPPRVRITLQQAVEAALANNLSLQSARLTPAINQAEVVAAEAAFDWVFFATFDWIGTDEPSRVPVVNGFQTGAGFSESQSVAYSTGLRKPLTTGGQFSIVQGQNYFDDTSPGIAFAPDPSNEAFVTIGYNQPLLRGFGTDVALSDLRIAVNAERRAIQTLRQSTIDTVTETERAYWALYQATRTLQILQRNLESGIETRDILGIRRGVDARPAEYSDAQATVERRRADVIRAINQLRRASDRLKVLMNAPELPVGSAVVIAPADAPIDEPITYSLFDELEAAISGRPDMLQAILDIDNASIRYAVARNAKLPRLDFSIEATSTGLARGIDDAYDQVGETDFLSWVLGLDFEQAIGNRQAEAAFRRVQLQRLQSKITYDATRQRVVDDVVAALRSIQENFDLIEQTRVQRYAAAESLRTLLALEETIQARDANFLNLKFNRQEGLANAELAELQSLVDYNVAVAELHRATGEALQRNRIRLVVPNAGDFDTGRRLYE